MTQDSYDYVVAGGGLTGCVVASRLADAGHSVALIEAGPEDYGEKIMSPVAAPHLHNTPYEYNMNSVPQPGFDNRSVAQFAGKLLSGSSAVNYGLWTRGHSADYDAWATVSNDERWSYKNMLRYFKKIETHYDSHGNKDSHGFDGPISTTAGARIYPLRESMKQALSDSGLEFNPDTNGGNPFGFGSFTENWKDAKRQPAGLAYSLAKAKVMTNSLVTRVLFKGSTATGVELSDGTQVHASKEVLISCGALRTPQLLMLSGVGPSKELSKHGIPLIADLPVGQGLHDHNSANLFWKLKHPERGQALGDPLFHKPEYATGNPMEWIATISTPEKELTAAAKLDGISAADPYLKGPRGNVEVIVAYAPIASGNANYRVPFDGKHISTPVVLLLPTSRGSVTLADTNAASDPVIDPNYLQTETDRAALRAGMRQALRVMETDAAREVVEGETPPPGFEVLSSRSSDADLDARIAHVGNSFYQYAGTAAMGHVVDSRCRVLGLQSLRVVDASVLPVPLAGHYQAPMYAFGEAAADLLLGK